MKTALSKNKSVTAFALVLILAFSAFIVLLPTINAQTTAVPTYSFIALSPNPAGVNETVLVSFWLGAVPPSAAGPTGDRWQSFTLTITKPDGTTETRGPFTSDPIGGYYIIYAPSVTGTYKFQMSYSGQSFPERYGGTNNATRYPAATYAPSTSNIAELIVQQDGTTRIPDNTPTGDYWSRPINAQNKGYTSVASNWLMSGGIVTNRNFHGGTAIVPDGIGPETSHVMWTRPIAAGGIVGGAYGDDSFYTGLAYEMKLQRPLIINGIFYYNEPNYPQYGWYAIDLQTGEELWYNNGTGIPVSAPNLDGYGYQGLSFGQLLLYNSPNQHGVVGPYLWSAPTSGFTAVIGGTWKMYDAFTGNWILDVANVPTGTTVFGPNGEILVYTTTGNILTMWNSTKAIQDTIIQLAHDTNNRFADSIDWCWRPPTGQTINGTLGNQWSVNLTIVSGVTGQSIGRIIDGVIYVNSGPAMLTYDWLTGEMLSKATRVSDPNVPHGTTNAAYGSVTYGNGVAVEWVQQKLFFIGYNVSTGNEIWRTDPITDQWSYYTYAYNIYDGTLYSSGYDGMIHAWDVATGQKMFDFYTGSSSGETPYGHYPFYGGFTIAGNRLYQGTDEHSPDSVLPRGEKLFALDATTGEQLWNLTGWFELPAVADGYLISVNSYDNQIYCIGKGPSQTTVEAPTSGVTAGSVITIKGTVTDQSAGSKDTPAISDEYMSKWMGYLYSQEPLPTDAKGVQVTLTATDPNGHSTIIGTATSNNGGTYGISWTPAEEGIYTITANFAGTKAYGSSYATTVVAVGPAASAVTTPTTQPTITEAPTTTVSVTPTPTPSAGVEPGTGISAETLLIAAAAIIIIAVIVAAAVLLRRRQ